MTPFQVRWVKEGHIRFATNNKVQMTLDVNGNLSVNGNIKAPNFKIKWGKVEVTNWINNWDAVMNYKVPDGCVMVGLYSEHKNSKEDRRFKIYYRSISVG